MHCFCLSLLNVKLEGVNLIFYTKMIKLNLLNRIMTISPFL